MKSHHHEKHKVAVAVQVIFFDGEKILMARRQNTGFEDGKYGFAAGHIEDHETPRQAGVREAKEEVGLETTEDDLEFVHAIYRINLEEHPSHQEWVDFAFVCRKWQGSPKIMEPQKCDHVAWFSLNEIPENTIPYLKQVIDCWQKGIYYSENQRP